MRRKFTMRRRLGAATFAALLCAGCAKNLPPVTTLDLDRIRQDRPNATIEGLEKGRSSFAHRCGSCHLAPAPASHPAADWPKLVESMRERSMLDSLQAEHVLDWILLERIKHAGGS